MIKRCVVCEGEFEPRRGHKTCSTKCSKENRRRKLHADYLRTHVPVSPKTTICVSCQNSFIRHANGPITCSDACKASRIRLRRKESGRRRYQHADYPPKLCCICQTRFKPRKKTHVTCSSECAEMRGKMTSTAWRRSHPEKYREYRRTYLSKPDKREKVKIYRRKHYQETAVSRRIVASLWREKRPDKIREYRQRETEKRTALERAARTLLDAPKSQPKGRGSAWWKRCKSDPRTYAKTRKKMTNNARKWRKKNIEKVRQQKRNHEIKRIATRRAIKEMMSP